jgi:hypothetical protein
VARVRVSISAMLCIATSLTILPATAGANIRWGTNWAFVGTTLDGPNGDVEDPINVVFHSGATPFEVHHNQMMNAWPGMANNACLGADPKSYVEFLRSNGTVLTYSGFGGSKPADDQMTNNGDCALFPGETEYHARMWNSSQHNHEFHPGAFNHWSAVGVHHEKRVGTKHKIDMNFEAAEKVLLNQLSEFCTYRNWRLLPGTLGRFHDWWSDGYVSRVTPETNGPGTGGSCLASASDADPPAAVPPPPPPPSPGTPGDTTPPTVWFLDINIYRNQHPIQIWFKYTGHDNHTPTGQLYFGCSKDGNDFYNCTADAAPQWHEILVGHGSGHHYFRVHTRDGVGNFSSVVRFDFDS